MTQAMADRSVLLQVDPRGAATITLNRPDVHNAFNEDMMLGLTQTLEELREQKELRIVLIVSKGESFCAGADLNYMRKAAGFSEAENEADAHKIGAMLAAVSSMPVPTVALVQGAVYGGGVGLLAATDIVVAVKHAVFALTEVKLGIIPAMISPWVLAAIGPRQARRYFQTGERFSAQDAQRLGLVHEVVANETALTAQGEHVIDQVLKAAPGAVHEAKKLVEDVSGRPVNGMLMDDLAKRIAKRRASDEGKEGIGAFLERRKANWVV